MSALCWRPDESKLAVPGKLSARLIDRRTDSFLALHDIDTLLLPLMTCTAAPCNIHQTKGNFLPSRVSAD